MADDKQVSISRQSSLKLFQTYFGKLVEDLPLQYVLRITEVISNYTLEGNTAEITKVVKAIDTYKKEQQNGK